MDFSDRIARACSRGVVRTLLLATAMGVGVGSTALADQAAPSTGLEPTPVSMNKGVDIIQLADAGSTVASRAQASPSASSPSYVLADATPAAPAAAPASNPMDHLGTNIFERFWNYEKLEWRQPGPPSDPNAPASRRADLPPQPESSPPMPFTEWPYGGTTNLGTNRTASVDAPLMVAIANTSLGKAMNAAGIQFYGWVDYGGNLSSSKVKYGNSPAAYDFQPNSISLDQAVVYLERTPDTVQTDHIDWGFRLSAIYGTNYRYTTSYGLASYQYLQHNHNVGYDFPMLYGEIFIPKIAQGLLIRVGRYISLPDIEAQLAPNNYMYSHSITYTLDNYTNEGIQASLLLTKNITLQAGLSVGTETTVWNLGVRKPNLYVLGGNPDPLYPGKTFLKDPGAQATGTLCARFQSNSAKDNIYFCANGINSGAWGYNNLQWYGLTYYHKFSDKWHIAVEIYNEHQNSVPNALNPTAAAIYSGGGTPFSPQYIPINGPYLAQCKNPAALKCTASAQAFLDYLNYQPTPLDNISLRTEMYDDEEGQRTGTAAIYYDVGLGWQHWLNPQIEMRPEVTYYWATKAAFNIDGVTGLASNPSKHQLVWSGDIIVHF